MRVPALNERTDDIALLAQAFVEGFCRDNGLRNKKIEPEVFEVLARRSWPGNVRELKNVVERAAILASDVITVVDLPEDPHANPFDDDAVLASSQRSAPKPGRRLSLREYREQAERTYIIDTLNEVDWNVSKAAALLGVERTNLHKKIRAYDIRRGES